MEVAQVKVSLQYTYNMGNYTNCKPTVEMVANLEPGDNPDVALTALQDKARQFIYAEIDKALDANDQPPQFYTGPRYNLLVTEGEKLAAIVPEAMFSKLPGAWPNVLAAREDRPYEQVIRYYEKRYAEYTLYDCSSGDLSILPPLEKFYVCKLDRGNLRLIAWGTKDFTRDKLPQGLYHWADLRGANRLADHLQAELVAEAAQGNWLIVDVTDGDYGKLADLVSQIEAAAPVEEEDEIPFEDDDEDDDNDRDDEE